MSKKKWDVQSVIFLAIIAIFLGIIYQVWSYAYYALAATPLKPYANDLTLGVWTMAGPLAGTLLRKVGGAFIGELLTATVEMFLFSSWGAANLISGLYQGLGSELGFALTGYKNFGKLGLSLSVLTTTIITFAWSLFQDGYLDYQAGMLVQLFILRLLSIGLFSGVLVAMIQAAVKKAGFLR